MQPGLGVGAIGIATEMVVPLMYQYILDGIRRHSTLEPRDYYFFELHAGCDEAHALSLLAITEDLAQNFGVREAIRFGVFSALNLRKAFWDIMQSRAVAAVG